MCLQKRGIYDVFIVYNGHTDVKVIGSKPNQGGAFVVDSNGTVTYICILICSCSRDQRSDSSWVRISTGTLYIAMLFFIASFALLLLSCTYLREINVKTCIVLKLFYLVREKVS
jgi:hypothetical protein